MTGFDDIVVTGLGCVTPLGIGREAFTSALLQQRCAIEPLHELSDSGRTTFYGARVADFAGKDYVTPRKALKVMSREVQMAYSAAHLAWLDAGVTPEDVVAERTGVVFGSEMIPGDVQDLVAATRACEENGSSDLSLWGQRFGREIFPLWMLKNLPNMPACHVGIAIDARGPNNSIAQEEVSGLLALSEAAMIMQRGQADLMLVGGLGSRVTPTRFAYRQPGWYCQHPTDPAPPEATVKVDLSVGVDQQREQTAWCRPFDGGHSGIVTSEGAVTLVLERRSTAIRRGAKAMAVVAGFGSSCCRPVEGSLGSRRAIRIAAEIAMEEAGISNDDLAFVSAQGYSERRLDIEEAAAIQIVAPETPVVAFSSYFGTCGAASSLLQLAASMVTLKQHQLVPIYGHRATHPECEIRVVMEQQTSDKSHFLQLSFTPQGQAAATVIQCLS